MLQSLLRCAGRAIADTIRHDGIEHAGYLAFLGLLALFPFLVFVVSVMGVIGPETATAHNLATVFGRLPPDVIKALTPRVNEITSGPPQSLLTIAILGALWTASSAVEGLRTILNRAYRVHNPLRYVLRRTLSILQLLVFAFVLIVGMTLLVALPPLLDTIHIGVLNISVLNFWKHLIYGASLIVLLLLVAWIYYAVPNIRQRWVSVWPGTVLCVLLWVGASRLFALYMANFNQLTLIYGSLGGIIAALVFFYICNVIFIFGAEFNHHVSVWAGMKVVEREKA